MNTNRRMARLVLNLKNFATTTQTTGLSALSAEMKTYYEKRLLDLAEPKLVHNQFGDKYPIPKGGGKTIEFRKYDSLGKATTPITEGVTPDGNNLNVTTLTATISQYGDWIQLSDLLDLTAIDNNVVQATKLLGSQAGRTLDTITRDVLAGGTNVIYAPKVADGAETAVTSRAGLDATAKISVDLIFKAAAQLEGMNADPIDDSFVAIIHPYVAYDLMRCDEWSDAHKYATPDNIYAGEIGKIGNVRFVKSTEAKIWNDSTCPVKTAASSPNPATYYSVFSTVVLGAHAYGVTEVEGGGLQHIVKQLGYGDDPLNQRSSCGWKATHVAKRLVEQYMVRIESCSAYSATAAAN